MPILRDEVEIPEEGTPSDLNPDREEPMSFRDGKRKEQFIEVSVFLFLVVPSMVLSFFAMNPTTLSFGLVAFATILRDLSLVSLVLFFLRCNREPLRRIGWTFKRWGKEGILGVGLFFPLFLGSGILEKILRTAGFSAPLKPLPSFLGVKNLEDIILAPLLVVVVALAEETIFRGYLLLRFRALTSSPTISVLLSAAIFSIGHGYEGSAGVITVGVMGVVFGVIYLWRQSLVAPMVLHFLQDFIGIVLIPLSGMR
jgi:membrane protease YdiL (CAAX protease family)